MNAEKMHKMAVERAKARMGAGWALLSADLHEALIAREALTIIAANADNPGYEKAAALAHHVLTA